MVEVIFAAEEIWRVVGRAKVEAVWVEADWVEEVKVEEVSVRVEEMDCSNTKEAVVVLETVAENLVRVVVKAAVAKGAVVKAKVEPVEVERVKGVEAGLEVVLVELAAMEEVC